MTSVVFSVFLLLQAAVPAAVRECPVASQSKEMARSPSSFTLPLMAAGGAPTPRARGGAGQNANDQAADRW